MDRDTKSRPDEIEVGGGAVRVEEGRFVDFEGVREGVAPPTDATATGTGADDVVTGQTYAAPAASSAPAFGAAQDETHQPIAMVREGMKVVDAAGDDLGRVTAVKMGDPQAITIEGQEFSSGNLVEGIADAAFGSEPDVPDPFRTDLIRRGFVKIDGKGWFDTDRYVFADMVAAVSGDTVRLSVTKDQLPAA